MAATASPAAENAAPELATHPAVVPTSRDVEPAHAEPVVDAPAGDFPRDQLAATPQQAAPASTDDIAPHAPVATPGSEAPGGDGGGQDRAPAATDAPPQDATAPLDTMSTADQSVANDADTAPVVAPASAPPQPATVIAPASATTPSAAAPSFARARTAGVPLHRRHRAVAATAGLSLLLALQLLLAQRDQLAARPGWRPAMTSLCSLLRCRLPPWREPTAFTMLSRHVRPHPEAPGTLLVDASFRNDARWPQPWPRLMLTLSDVDGRTVGARSFVAREYLGASPTQSELAPGQTAALTLAVVEPAPNVVAFHFDFR
jgi:hypothetical protein